MGQIDKTKENIRVENLDDAARKELFKKFVSAGGEVVREKPQHKKFDRNKQAQYQQSINEHQKKMQKSGKNNFNYNDQLNKKKNQTTKSQNNFMTKFNIGLHLKFGHIADSRGNYLTPSFLKKLDLEYKTALLETQTIFFEIFKQNPEVSQLIINRLDKENPIYVELMDMMSAIYEPTLFLEILEYHNNFPDVKQPIADIKDPLLSLFKQLYVLNNYQQQLYYGFDQAINNFIKISKKSNRLFSSSKRKIKNDLYIVFNQLYPKLFWVACSLYKEIFQVGTKRTNDLLEISTYDYPGLRKKFAPTFFMKKIAEEKENKEDTTTEEKNEKEKIDPAIKDGLDLMYKIDYEERRKIYDKSQIFKNLATSDKLLITYLLFQEFDNEYSLVLISGKIKYNTNFTSGGKVDYKEILSDLYNGMHKCRETFREYEHVSNSYYRTKMQRPNTRNEFLTYSQNITKLEKDKKLAALNARMRVTTFIAKTTETLKILVDDLNSECNLILNPQEMFLVNQGIEGEKKLDGKKIYAAFITVYNFCAAFNYRLAAGGDLAGKLEFKEKDSETEEKAQNEKISQAVAESNGNTKKTEVKKESNSVLDELNDFF